MIHRSISSNYPFIHWSFFLHCDFSKHVTKGPRAIVQWSLFLLVSQMDERPFLAQFACSPGVCGFSLCRSCLQQLKRAHLDQLEKRTVPSLGWEREWWVCPAMDWRPVQGTVFSNRLPCELEIRPAEPSRTSRNASGYSWCSWVCQWVIMDGWI